MGVQQSKHSYVYKPKKKLQKKAIHNSVFVEKPEYLIYDDVIHNSIDDNAKYNTTKSCMDIRAIQKRKDQSRPLSLDEDMLERPKSNISNVMHQYRQEVANEIAKIAPPIGETVSSKSLGSSDGFKDVYDDDYYDNQMDSGDFKDAMSYHSLDIDTVRPTEIDAAVGKLNKSVEFEFEKMDSSQKLSRRSSSRRVKDNTLIQRKPSDVTDVQANTSSKIDEEVIKSSKDNIETNFSSETDLEANNSSKTALNPTADLIAGTSSNTDLAPSKIPPTAPVETVRQLSTESTIEETVTPKEIITLEDVTNILQVIKDKMLHGEINDTEVYHQLLMCKKKAQSIHVTSIQIRAKKTMLIGKINKFIHWFAIAEPHIHDNKEINMKKGVMNGSANNDGAVKNHYENDAKVAEDNEVVPYNEQFDAKTIFIVNTMKEQHTISPEIEGTNKSTNPFITSSSNSENTENVCINNHEKYENIPKIDKTVNNLMNHNYNGSTAVEQEVQQNINNTIEQEDQQITSTLLPFNVYEEINNIRLLLQEVHNKMDAFTGRRYDLEYHNIIDEVFQARIILNNVKGTELLEDDIIEDYEKFFEDLLLYFEELVDRNERTYDNVMEPDHETVDDRKTVGFETQTSLSESEYYTNVNNRFSFDHKSETSTNLSESENGSSTHFVSLTEYDGNLIQTCETFNKTIELQEDDEADLSPDDDFIYKTNAVGQIVFEHEESQKPYIVDPISFSKCRMRPLSIIQEQLDEFLECHYPENKEEQIYSSMIHDTDQESEDRDDWDSVDDNMVKLYNSSLEKDDEIEEFEELERNIDNIRSSMSDLVLNNRGWSENNEAFEEEDQRNGDFEADDQNYGELDEGKNQDFDKGCRNDSNFKTHDQNNDSFDEECRNDNFEANDRNNDDSKSRNDDFQEVLSCERYVNEVELLPGQSKHVEIANEENIIEQVGANDYYSLESMADMLPDDKAAENITGQAQYENFKVENETSKSQYNNDAQEEFVQPTTGNNSLDQPSTQNNEEILNLTNYNFGTVELKSYNEIMKINSIIDGLQSQIDHFVGTKSSPEYMATFKRIFDNMRLLNNIDNCDYEEDLLNLIDYTSDKIQKCIFDLDLKVS